MARTRLVSSVASRGALQVACGFRPCSGLLGWRADPSRRFLLSVVGNLFLDVYLPGLGARTRLLARPSATSRLGSFRTAQLHGHDRARSGIENMPLPQIRHKLGPIPLASQRLPAAVRRMDSAMALVRGNHFLDPELEQFPAACTQ
jgi:hypothetical protein